MFLELVINSADIKQECICQNTEKIRALISGVENIMPQLQTKVTITLNYCVQECLLSACESLNTNSL